MIQGLACDKVSCTRHNQQHIFKLVMQWLLQGHSDAAHNLWLRCEVAYLLSDKGCETL